MWPTEASELWTVWSRGRSKGQNGAGSTGHTVELVASSTPVALLSKPYNTTQKMKTETVPCGVKLESTREPEPHEPSESEGRTCKSLQKQSQGLWEAAVSWVMALVCESSTPFPPRSPRFPSSISFTPVREESEVVEGTHTEPAHSTNHTLSQRKKGECGGMGLQLKGQQRIKQINNMNLRNTAGQARSEHHPSPTPLRIANQ